MFNPYDEEEPSPLIAQQPMPVLGAPADAPQSPAPAPINIPPQDPLESTKRALIADYLTKKNATQALPATAPVGTAPDSGIDWKSKLAIALGGFGDAYSASAGRPTGTAKQIYDIGQNAPKVALEKSEAQRTMAQQKEMDDPLSGTSQQYQMLASKYTGKMPQEFQGMSATKIAAILPIVEKSYATDQTSKERLEAARIAAQSHSDALRSQESWKEAMFGQKNDVTKQRQWTQFQTQNDPSTGSSRTVIGMLGRANLNADRAINLLKNNPSLTNADLGNITADIAGIFQGGSPTDIGMKHQNYDTLFGKVKNLMQFISGKPQDSVPPAIRAKLLSSLMDLRNTNTALIKSHNDQLEKSNKWLVQDHGDEWQNFRSQVEGGGAQGGAAKPKTVKQNGHIYTLNEQTNQYE